MKKLKNILLIILGLFAALALFSLWYSARFSMDEVEPYQVNSVNMQQKLLIATQGSEYKDQLTKGIINHFKSDSVFIQVIDVTSLDTVDAEQYDGIAIIHTWEKWSAPEPVVSFISRNKNMRDRIIVMITTGGSEASLAHVDAIVGESELAELPEVERQIIDFLDTLIKS